MSLWTVRNATNLAIISSLVGQLLFADLTQAQSIDPRHQKSLEVAQQLLAEQPESPRALVRLADAQLRAGQCAQAVRNFQAAIELDPPSEPYLWQYGIALFFEGKFAEGAKLFEKHRLVNRNDVENAAWHFLCVAKDKGTEQARKLVLPAPGDPRPPMGEILKRLGGGDSSEILAKMEELEGKPGHSSCVFYGQLYLGLIADAEGKPKETIIAALRAASELPMTHYMADVARVYLQRVQARK